MNTSIVTLQYNDFPVIFQSNAFLNATAIAKHFGKEPKNYLRTNETKEYISALQDWLFPSEESNGLKSLIEQNQTVSVTPKSAIEQNQLVIVKGGSTENGGGTWLHPKLAVNFARWLDVRFAVWCDMQIDKLLKPVPNALRDLPPAQPKTLTPAMLRHIQRRVAILATQQVGCSYSSLGRLIKDTFNVNKRENIPISKYSEVCALLGCQPDAKAMQAELPEQARLETKETPFVVNASTFTLSPAVNQRVVVYQSGGVASMIALEDDDMFGSEEAICRELLLRGYLVVKKDTLIDKIAQFKA